MNTEGFQNKNKNLCKIKAILQWAGRWCLSHPHRTDKSTPVRVMVMERNEELEARSAFSSSQRVQVCYSCPSCLKSFHTAGNSRGGSDAPLQPSAVPIPFSERRRNWYWLVWVFFGIFIFFGKRIEKDADSIAHHHLMMALSKTPDCCPQKLGASSPSGLA